MTGLKEQLEKKFGRDFHHTLHPQTRGQGPQRNHLDSAKIEKRLASTCENYRLMREELIGIVYSGASAKDRVEAATAVVMMDLAVLNAEMATGLYKKPSEEIAQDLPVRATSGCGASRRHRGLAAWRLATSASH